VRQVERPVAREIDHAPLRAWKALALNFQLDLRRPEQHAGPPSSGAPGHRFTLPDLLAGFLRERALPAGLDRAAFVAQGLELLAAVEDTADGG
jgi:hypothetical protein